MNEKWKYGLIGAFVGGISVWFFMTNTLNSSNVGMMNFNSNTNSQGRGGMLGNIDQHFIEQMIPHHEDAITMAKLALTKAQKSEVKLLAKSIIDSQGKEINQMKSWYATWYGKDVPGDNSFMNQHGMTGNTSRMHMGMMGDGTDMTRLEEAADFDKAFVEEMIPHHQMAVMMATMLNGGTNRAEMKKLADDIITAQTKEIGQMRGWLTAWGY